VAEDAPRPGRRDEAWVAVLDAPWRSANLTGTGVTRLVHWQHDRFGQTCYLNASLPAERGAPVLVQHRDWCVHCQHKIWCVTVLSVDAATTVKY
jgi:hypothetical protein